MEWMPSILIPKSAELPASVHHWRAQTGLEALGPLAVPALLELSGETNVALRAEEVLIQIGADGIPILMAVLTNRSSQFRVEATRALGLLGHQADMAVPMLLMGLKDQDKVIRDASATALCLVSTEAAHQAGLRWERKVWRQWPSGRNEVHVIFGWPETSSPPQEVQEPR
jgi:hypothetical protein